MKKYLMSSVVLLAAGLAAFAFNPRKTTPGPKQANLYWYTVTYNTSYPSGVILSSADIRFSGVARTQASADANDGCSGTVKQCLRGFSSTLASFPNTTSPVSTTTKN
jgi:hypothetical protein